MPSYIERHRYTNYVDAKAIISSWDSDYTWKLYFSCILLSDRQDAIEIFTGRQKYKVNVEISDLP
jgi:hypothetical protein